MIEIVIDSQFDHYERYTMIAMCGGFNASAEQLYVVSAQKNDSQSTTSLEVPDADRIELITYLLPKELPQTKHTRIDLLPPFEITITVYKEGRAVYNAPHMINAWSGAAINLKIEL